MIQKQQTAELNWQVVAENLMGTIDRGAAILDARFVILCANPAFESATGLRSGSLLPHSFQLTILSQVADNPSIHLPSPAQPIEGFSFSSTPVLDAKGQKTGYYLAFTNQVSAVALRTLTNDQEQFAYQAAHDLQNPLSIIQSFGKLLKRRYSQQLATEGNEFLDFMLDASVKARKLIGGLLAYFVLPAPVALVPVELDKVLEKVVINLTDQIQAMGASIYYNTLPVVLGDAAQLTKVFEHLIRNAITFKGESAPIINITATLQTSTWCVAVKDNGTGIEPSHLATLFDGLQRHHSRERYDGTGLGLALCKKIVAFHGGTIWATSEFGIGSTFYMTFQKEELLLAD